MGAGLVSLQIKGFLRKLLIPVILSQESVWQPLGVVVLMADGHSSNTAEKNSCVGCGLCVATEGKTLDSVSAIS